MLTPAAVAAALALIPASPAQAAPTASASGRGLCVHDHTGRAHPVTIATWRMAMNGWPVSYAGRSRCRPGDLNVHVWQDHRGERRNYARAYRVSLSGAVLLVNDDQVDELSRGTRAWLIRWSLAGLR